MQYTVRNISARIDRAAREEAREQGKSLNQTLVDALEGGLGLTGEQQLHDDLDWIAGSWVDNPGFDEAVAEQDRVDMEDSQ